MKCYKILAKYRGRYFAPCTRHDWTEEVSTGKWAEVEGQIRICYNGLHAAKTNKYSLFYWLREYCQEFPRIVVFEAFTGKKVIGKPKRYNKICAKRMRIGKKVAEIVRTKGDPFCYGQITRIVWELCGEKRKKISRRA